MVTSMPNPQTTLQEVIERILSSHRIAQQDQEILLGLLSSGSLTEADKLLVNRVYTLLSRGFIEVID
ncbi:hypothetical protein [Oscillatoria sp. FACHB-1406]|uniref:hypothetical protein n=1 Tax=Oscillatoria sp. FACHB-1406 TaxID=2692846 RepID=UPI0016847F5A|nr:hypothetical protein [Oscillatoria sp. FACHB-1406]MBD2580610.1 hypothetical protein [Oscillatoria sp. FACHB-1406]